jgi:hypothetical protein
MSVIEQQVCDKILKRSEVGKKKYGTTMERGDLSTLEWLKHTQEELMDACVYIEKLINDLEEEESYKNCCCESRIPKWVRTSSLEGLKEKESKGD